MNFIDVLLIIIFFAMLAVGFFQGMIRLLVLIAAFYLSLVLASLYYPVVGDFFVREFNSQRFVGQYVGFGIVLLFAMLALSAAGIYTFRYAQLPGQLQYIDRIVGTVLGMFLGALFVGIFSTLLWNLMIVRGGASIDFPIMRTLGGAVASSPMLQYFSSVILPQAYAALDPILPDGAGIIFAVQ